MAKERTIAERAFHRCYEGKKFEIYVEGATDQRKIDIEKAKESFCKSNLCRPYKECKWGSDGCGSMQRFIKAMEE